MLSFIVTVLIYNSIMCVHPVVSRDSVTNTIKYEPNVLDEFDNCDYVYKLNNICKDDLFVLQLNIRGITSKKSQLIDLIENSATGKCPDVILLSETWLTPFSPDLVIPGYSFYHKCRLNKRGGGVGILVSQKIRCKLCSDFESSIIENECLTLDITLQNGDHCIVSSMYRPPNVNAQTFLGCYNSILCQMKKESPKTIIIGLDHNMDFLKSAEHTLTNDFIQSNLDFGLVPTITRPTRITHSSATLIDNIIVSQNLCGRHASSVLINDISDHLPTACIIPSLIASKKGPIAITSRDTRPKNMKALKRQLTETNWSIELGSDSCNSNMAMLTKILTNAIDRCIPEQTRYLNSKSLRREPWLTSGLKRSIDRNNKLYGESLQCPLTHEKYKYYNNALHKSIKKAKIDYYKEKCREYKTQTKKLWKLINEISGKRNDKLNLVDYLKIDDVQVYNAKKISNSFAKYFSEVGEKFAKKVPSLTKSISEYMKVMGSNTRSIFLEPTDENEIRKIAFDLPNKSSSGHDRISNVLLKEIIAQIAEPLSMIFNQSLQTGEFPSDMKLAEVVPLCKSKEYYLESNYQPISLLTTISKILEKVVYKRVYKFLTESSQLYDNQYGFYSNHSCKHAISQTVGNLLKNLENKKNSVCVLLDLSKAFDTIEHSIMLEKLELYGIRGTALSWFHSYLSDRRLRVKCRTTSCGIDTQSDEFTVKYGTPQGSCLGPLIFLIFVNDLHLHLSDAECIVCR